MSDKAYLAALHRVDELKRERDQLREALELVLFCDKDDVVYARTKARAALDATKEKAQ